MTEANFAAHNRVVYDAAADEYEKRSQEGGLDYYRLGVDHFMKFLKPGGRILNPACAVGGDIYHFRRLGCDVTGVDISFEMVRHARARNPDTSILEGDFMELDLGEGSFDGVFAWAFIHLFPKEEALEVLARSRDLLCEGGVALFATTKSDESSEGWYIKEDYGMSIPRYRKFWTPDELAESLTAVGLTTVDYSEIDGPHEKKWMVFTVQKTKISVQTA